MQYQSDDVLGHLEASQATTIAVSVCCDDFPPPEECPAPGSCFNSGTTDACPPIVMVETYLAANHHRSKRGHHVIGSGSGSKRAVLVKSDHLSDILVRTYILLVSCWPLDSLGSLDLHIMMWTFIDVGAAGVSLSAPRGRIPLPAWT